MMSLAERWRVRDHPRPLMQRTAPELYSAAEEALLEALEDEEPLVLEDWVLAVDELFHANRGSVSAQQGQRRWKRQYKWAPPVPWYWKAREVSRGYFDVVSGGRCGVYVILLNAETWAYAGGYALYVGESAHPAEVRYRIHKSGVGPSGRSGIGSAKVKRYGWGLLPDLYSHFPRLTRERAKALEKELARRLKAAGIPTYVG